LSNKATEAQRHGDKDRSRDLVLIYSWFALCLCVSAAQVSHAQIESVESSAPRYTWISHGRVEGHLALAYSPAAAFSPDSTALAVVIEDKVVLMDLAAGEVRSALRPHVEGVTDLTLQSANYVAPNRLFLLANGLFRGKDKRAAGPTPTIGFQWDTEQNTLFGKVNAIGASGGFTPPRYFPQIGYLVMYKDSNFDLWHPVTGRAGHITLPSLTRRPNVFEFSPDGHWLLLAQLEASSTPDPVVVELREHRFVDALRGHQGTVLSMAFSRDDTKVATACEDEKIRIWSVPGWQLLKTLEGHHGPVHWAEFSPDGTQVVSGGEDRTVRVWSAEEGTLEQTLEESKSPILTVAFSPNGEYIVGSAEDVVLIWQRTVSSQ
jgi:WD40 repeat protein